MLVHSKIHSLIWESWYQPLNFVTFLRLSFFILALALQLVQAWFFIDAYSILWFYSIDYFLYVFFFVCLCVWASRRFSFLPTSLVIQESFPNTGFMQNLLIIWWTVQSKILCLLSSSLSFCELFEDDNILRKLTRWSSSLSLELLWEKTNSI